MYNEPKKICLGYGGEYCGVKQARDIARNHFLQVVAEFCPEVVRDLKTRVLPIYSQWAEQAKIEEKYRSPLEGTIHPIFRTFLLIEKHAPIVAEALRQWSERYHLTGAIEPAPEWYGDDWPAVARAESLWPCSGALATLYAWHWRENGPKMANLDPPGWPRYVCRTACIPKTITLKIPHFVPEQQRRSAYSREVLRLVATALDKHIAKQIALAEAAGRRRTAQKHRPEHFTWLALRQVYGWNSQQIACWHAQATHYNVECDAVRHGIRDTARFIRLTSRIAKKGRPTGKPGDLR